MASDGKLLTEESKKSISLSRPLLVYPHTDGAAWENPCCPVGVGVEWRLLERYTGFFSRVRSIFLPIDANQGIRLVSRRRRPQGGVVLQRSCIRASLSGRRSQSVWVVLETSRHTRGSFLERQNLERRRRQKWERSERWARGSPRTRHGSRGAGNVPRNASWKVLRVRCTHDLWFGG